VILTIDTNNLTEHDRALMTFVLSGETDPYAASLASTTQAAPAATTEETKPKRTRRPKAQIEEESERMGRLAAEAAVEEAKPESQEPQPDTGDSVTIEEVTEIASELITKDRAAMVGLLKQYGARRVSEIPESDLGKFAAEIRAKLTA
jgi:FAD/FMN-containing dehydrogenase